MNQLQAQRNLQDEMKMTTKISLPKRIKKQKDKGEMK